MQSHEPAAITVRRAISSQCSRQRRDISAHSPCTDLPQPLAMPASTAGPFALSPAGIVAKLCDKAVLPSLPFSACGDSGTSSLAASKRTGSGVKRERAALNSSTGSMCRAGRWKLMRTAFCLGCVWCKKVPLRAAEVGLVNNLFLQS